MASSSTTEPWASCRMFLIEVRVRPISTDSWTGMSMMRSMSHGALDGVCWSCSRTCGTALAASGCTGAEPIALGSALPSAGGALFAKGVSLLMLSALRLVGVGVHGVDAHRVVAVELSELALEDGQLAHLQLRVQAGVDLD